MMNDKMSLLPFVMAHWIDVEPNETENVDVVVDDDGDAMTILDFQYIHN